MQNQQNILYLRQIIKGTLRNLKEIYDEITYEETFNKNYNTHIAQYPRE